MYLVLYNNGDANLLQHLSLIKSLLKQQKSLPSCRSLKSADMWGAIAAGIFLLFGTDIAFVVKN